MLTLRADAPAASVVDLRAPYLLFNQSRYVGLQGADFFVQLGPEPLKYFHNGNRLNVSANLVDVRGLRDLIGFDDVRFDVQGDLRMGSPGFVDRSIRTKLAAPDRMTLSAAQIYPTTRGGGIIAAGEYVAKGPQGDIYSYNPKAVLTIRRASGDLPAVPYAAFGGLTLMAPLIEQGGVLRAPLGSIVFESNPQAPGTVRFLPGSLTSVSGAGLLMPYGGTVDGVKYLYAGNEVKPDATGSSGYDGRKIEIQGKAVEVAEGAVLDVSGGGELSGGAFVRGRGGSVDVLRYAMADANPGFGFSRSGNAVYAIVPGFAGNQAPIAADAGAGSPAVGRQVTIGAGVPAWAGTYTLLPSTYALLPGAFRVELGAQGAYDASAVAHARRFLGRQRLAGHGRHRAAALPTSLLSRRATCCGAMRNTTRPPTTPSSWRTRRARARGLMTVDARALQLTLDEGAGMPAAGAVVQGPGALRRAEGQRRIRGQPGRQRAGPGA